MDIKHGDIITLENGDEVKVSLEVISKKVTELVHKGVYRLRPTGAHCHVYSLTDSIHLQNYEDIDFQYVGEIQIQAGNRYIFFSTYRNAYAMFDTSNLDFVVKKQLRQWE